MLLENKVIVVTGAAQGLGAQIARRLGNYGSRLALIDLNLEKLQELKTELKLLDIDSEIFTADISDEDSVIKTFNEINKHFSGLDGLVNNAGIIRDKFLNKPNKQGCIESHPLSMWQSVIDVNLTGVFLCGREASRIMMKNNSEGVIVNISSISRAGNLGQSNYSAAKAGVVALTTTWAKELSRSNIRVAAIAPGFIKTDMTAGIKQEILQTVNSTIPLGRMGDPDEIAHTVQFIFENDYFNGRVIEVDGGLRI